MVSRQAFRTALILPVLCILVLVGSSPAAAQVSNAEQALIDKYAPILMLVPQEHACDSEGEPYDAGPADIVLADPAILLRWDVPGQPVVMRGPTGEDLARFGEQFYLDYPGNPLQPQCVYEELSRARMDGQQPTAHAHIAREPGRDGFAVQYWLFYYFNDFNNTHEGDWEMVQVVFDVNSVEEALGTEPIEVGYAQHGGGEKARWDDAKLEREGDRPVVYVARGSHASQFDRAIYLGWGENNTGFGCDVTEGADRRVPLQAVLIGGGASSTAEPAWVSFKGRWGQRTTWHFNGPYGPAQSEKWAEPLTWQDRLRPSSLAVPLSGTLGPTPTNVFCTISASSSALFRLWVEAPWAAVVLIGVVAGAIAGLLAVSRRTLATAMDIYTHHLPVFVPAGVAVLVVGLAASGIRWLGNLVYTKGPLADVPALWSMLTFAGHLAQQIVGLVLIAPMVIYATSELLAGRRPPLRDIVAQERRFLRRLVIALVRPFLLIGFLGLIPLGQIPALYLTVKRVFIPHAVVLDGAGPRAAWRQSSRVVEHRWWRTAALASTLSALVAIPSPVIGLLLLIVLGSSVAVVNLTSSLIYAIVSPFVFVATTVYFHRHREECEQPGVEDEVVTVSARP